MKQGKDALEDAILDAIVCGEGATVIIGRADFEKLNSDLAKCEKSLTAILNIDLSGWFLYKQEVGTYSKAGDIARECLKEIFGEEKI